MFLANNEPWLNLVTDWPLLLILVFAVAFGLLFPRLFMRSSYIRKWEKLYDRQAELLEKQLEALREINELLKKLTSGR